MKTFTYKDALKRGLEEYEFELFNGIKMMAYFENVPLEKGDRNTPKYGGFTVIRYITRKKDNKLFDFYVVAKHENLKDFVSLEDKIGQETYDY